MKDFMDFEEYKAMKEKRSKKMNSKIKKREDCDGEENLETLLTKKVKSCKPKNVKSKDTGIRNTSFKNNYKNFQYDYEEDLYDPDYGY